MKLEEVYKTIQLLKRDKRYDVFFDAEYSNPKNGKKLFMIIEHNPYQPVKELRSQGLYFMAFVADGYFHMNKKIYPIEALA